MKHLIVLLFTFLFFSCEEKVSGDLIIRNVTTIDAQNGLVENQTIVIRENRIDQVLTNNQVPLSDETTVIDGSGQFLIPGLWDAHVHFAYIEEMAPNMFDLFLRYGVTSVRDTGGKIEFVKEWKKRADAIPDYAPRVKIAGPLIDGEPNVYDGSTPARPELSVGNDDVEDVKRIVNQLADEGVDLLKAYEMLTPEQFIAVANTARQRGLKVTGHVPLSMDVISASEAGLNSMEHMRNLEMSCATNSAELLDARRAMLAQGKGDEGGVLRSRIHLAQRQDAIANYDETTAQKVLDVLKVNDTWQIPTLSIMTAMSKRPFANREWQETFQYLPKGVQERWAEGVDRVLANPPSESNEIYTQWTMHMVEKINDQGIPIMAGTDCPIFFLTPGRSLHEELNLLVQSGLSPLEAIASATVRPAEYFEMDDLGLIQEGMIADLLLLKQNPLDDIKHTMSITEVIKNGKVYEAH